MLVLLNLPSNKLHSLRYEEGGFASYGNVDADWKLPTHLPLLDKNDYVWELLVGDLNDIWIFNSTTEGDVRVLIARDAAGRDLNSQVVVVIRKNTTHQALLTSVMRLLDENVIGQATSIMLLWQDEHDVYTNLKFNPNPIVLNLLAWVCYNFS